MNQNRYFPINALFAETGARASGKKPIDIPLKVTPTLACNNVCDRNGFDLSRADDIAELIAKCALNDRSAFTKLYGLTSSKLFGVVLRILNNRADAEEALQEIYIKIWNNAQKFSANQYSPMSWLVVVARNHAIDIVRARKPVAVEIDDAFDVSDEAKTPEEMAINTSEGSRIEACLSELDTKKAEAVRQAYVEGYSYEELAQHHAVPINTMRTWLRRSLMSLKECLQR